MIKFTQDRRPHYGFTEVWVNPSDVMSIMDITGEVANGNKAYIKLRDGTVYYVTDHASTVAEKINSALEKIERHQADQVYNGKTLNPRISSALEKLEAKKTN